ncbi:Uncharacterized protein APZ42_031319 [Daphnia magna]|uniref:Uncharacterized protein n=1 Tax=Daphnia magna TaxID=35525 RepID=A0A164MZ08_9CRUS|nr:Uncharacterized protein APZ42_031319 [Daphnia magna]
MFCEDVIRVKQLLSDYLKGSYSAACKSYGSGHGGRATEAKVGTRNRQSRSDCFLGVCGGFLYVSHHLMGDIRDNVKVPRPAFSAAETTIADVPAI